MCNYCSTMHRTGREETWNPCQTLFSNHKTKPYAVLILNTEFNLPPSFLVNLWKEAKIRITVDGGTARWLTWLKQHNIDCDKVASPDLITGDMDSLPSDVLDYFINDNVCKIIKTPDQNETDFTKALKELNKATAVRNIDIAEVYVIADTSGRFDQIIANINTLCKATKFLSGMKVYQVASNSLTWLLLDGRHTIVVPPALIRSQEWCALIPLKSPLYVTTTGLKWNLDRSRMEFGGMVSTSNTYDEHSNIVTVHNDSLLVWSMGIETLLAEEH